MLMRLLFIVAIGKITRATWGSAGTSRDAGVASRECGMRFY